MKKISLLLTIFTHFLLCETTISVTDGHTQLTLIEQNQSSLRFHMEIGDLVTDEIQSRSGDIYSLLVLPKFHSSKNIGSPELPEIHQLIQIPHGAIPRIEINHSEEIEYSLDELGLNTIYPVQAPVSKSQNLTEIPFNYNIMAYTSDSFQNDDNISILDNGFLRQVRIGNLMIKPVDYNPVSRIVKVSKSIDFTIFFDNANLASTSQLQSEYYSPYFEPIYSQLINYDSPQTRNDDLINDNVTYVIVANHAFRGEMDEFIQWKIEKGFHVIVAYTDEIGFTASGIRAYIQELYNNPEPGISPPSFILLVGDTTQLPASYSSGGHVSDLDYCDFTGDMMPEILHGRFSAQTPIHLLSQINKTIEYEKFEFPDPGFLSKTLMISGVDASYAPTYGNGQINYGNQYYFNSAHGYNTNYTYLYPESNGNVDATIHNHVSSGVGFVNYTAHGYEQGWADPSFTTTDVGNLSNEHKYPLMIGNCCLTNAFDTGECFGESLLRAENKGAVGYIGGSDVTYWNEDYWWGVGSGSINANPNYSATGEGAYDGAFHDNGEDTWAIVNSAFMFVGNLAVVEANGMDDYYWEIYHLMGDPSVSTYFGTPDENTISYLPIIPMGSSSINVSALPNSLVGISQNGILLGGGFIGISGDEDFEIVAISSPDEISIVVTRQNTIPYLGNASVGNIDGVYLIMNNVQIDSGADNTILPGEEVDLIVHLENVGTENATSIQVNLIELINDPSIIITDGMENISFLASESSTQVTLSFRVDNNAAYGHDFALHIEATVDDQIYSTDINASVGAYMESFENDGFATQDWELSGDADWILDPFSSSNGDISVKSGTIDHNQSSELSLTMEIFENGFIHFDRRVSCEAVGSSSGNYFDYLAFYIDGVEQQKWAGELAWSQSSFAVTQGEHQFMWAFIKDQGVIAGEDAVWIDNIIFPPCFGASNSLSGDLNNDETVNILDIVIMVNYILEGEDNYAADVNNDGSVNVLDVVLVINIILEN